jgi:hypothetical protein
MAEDDVKAMKENEWMEGHVVVVVDDEFEYAMNLLKMMMMILLLLLNEMFEFPY